MNKTIIIILIFFIVSGCSKKDSLTRISDMSIPKITGFELKNEVGTIMKIIGLPNNKLSDKQSNYDFAFFPNPTKGIASLYINTPDNNEVKQIWVVQAQYDKIINDYSFDNGMINYTVGGAPLINEETTSNVFIINLKDLPNGYYRIYVKIGDTLLYDNIIIYE